MTQREDLIEELRRLPYDEVKIADFILAREKALLAEIEKPLKEALEYAWDSHTRIAELQWYKESIDEALAIIAKHGGQRDGD